MVQVGWEESVVIIVSIDGSIIDGTKDSVCHGMVM